MNPIYQTTKSNSLSACVATIVGTAIQNVPDFSKSGSQWEEVFFKCMESFHYSVCAFYRDSFLTLKGSTNMLCIALGKSKKTPGVHAAIVKIDPQGEFTLVHDPYPQYPLLHIEDISRVYTIFKSPNNMFAPQLKFA